MDSRFLRSLLLVVEHGSIAEAARAEHMTPAAIGQRIAALEAELSCQLLSRVGRQARPTPACLKLLPRARHIVEEIDRLSEDLDESGLSGTLRLGLISTAMSSYLPDSLQNLRSFAPGIHLTITPGTSRELYDSLLAGKLDAALLVAPSFSPPKSLAIAEVASEPLSFLSYDPLPDDQVHSIVDMIAREPFIRYDAHSWGGRLALTWLEQHGGAPNLLCDLDGPETIAQMVAQRMGVSLLPYWPGLEQWTDLFHGGHSIHVTRIRSKAHERRIQLIWSRDSERQHLIDAYRSALTNQTYRSFPAETSLGA